MASTGLWASIIFVAFFQFSNQEEITERSITDQEFSGCEGNISLVTCST